jgi:IPT/TIG domain
MKAQRHICAFAGVALALLPFSVSAQTPSIQGVTPNPVQPVQKVITFPDYFSRPIAIPTVELPPSVSIQSVAPNPAEPGQTLTVTMTTTGTPTGCVLTLIPYGQGNIPSIVSLNQPPPAEANISLPTTFPLGTYAAEVNCAPVKGTCPPGQAACNPDTYVYASKNVVVGGNPIVTAIEPSSATSGQTITIDGINFGQTQGQGYVHLIGSGVPDAYIVNGISSWSNTAIAFTLPEYASIGTYQVDVQTGTNGATPPLAGFSVAPAIKGWADLHTHPLSYLGFGGKLIYGAVDVGSWLPPVGGSCYLPNPTKQPIPPGSTQQYTLGVTGSQQDALGYENQVHGGAGLDNTCGDDIRNQVISGVVGDQTPTPALPISNVTTSGYQGKENNNPPVQDFPTWPAWNDIVNQRMWVDWIYRSYQGGLRVMVALAVNNKLLGDMTRGPGDLPDDDMTSGDLQISAITSFVGRNSGFMQIAKSSSDLFNIVSQGKLAVIIGVELDNIGNLTGNASAAQLVAEVDRLYGEGVRYIFPVHLVDNPIGGAAAYQDLFDYANYWEEGSFWDLGCSQAQSNEQDNITYKFDPAVPLEIKIAEGAKLWTVMPTAQAVPCSTPNTGNVNQRTLSSAGAQAIQEMMKNHMLIDVDHMDQFTVNATIALAQAHTPYPYPLMSGHNGVRGAILPYSSGDVVQPGGSTNERALTQEQYQAIGRLHGMAGVGSAKLTADQWLSLYTQVIQSMGPGAVAGFGTDMDGMEFGMPPRPGSNVQYGTDAFPLQMSSDGNRTWNYNYNTVGVAHYGMLPDFLADVASMSGGSDVISNMYGGAQYLYETWRIAEGNAQAILPPPPAPPTGQGPLPACPGTQQVNVLSGPTYGNLPSCVCPFISVQPSADGTCASSGANSISVGVDSARQCPANCKYGCSLVTGICNIEIYQTHPSSP